MKLIKPYTTILTPINGEEILKFIEIVARTCYKSEDKITEDSARKMVQNLISRGHEAMIEFYDITVKFVCDRGVSHEIVRHRMASYAQESTRYCNYAKDKFDNQITFVIPSWMNIQEGTYKVEWPENDFYMIVSENTGTWMPLEEKDGETRPKKDYMLWVDMMVRSEHNYNQLIEAGWQPQQARAILPNSLKTEINVKYNLREWRHFFKLRCSAAAHPQMRELTIPLLAEFQSKIPVIFDDIKF
jgi:thymidylate synthase (FAD)